MSGATANLACLSSLWQLVRWGTFINETAVVGVMTGREVWGMTVPKSSSLLGGAFSSVVG